MNKIDKIFIAAVMFTALVLFIGFGFLYDANASIKELSSDIVIIDVTDHSKYIIDKRFNLCFYESMTPYGIAVTKIDDCNNIIQSIK
ncbi:hypothetical protein LCGC14_1830770 [marine sediment metagenome]|uniref:Uncharacterized protein n=1 Tax=marine sediment metagenome TaxID=412755 RepID=A0A0F9IVR5_9ZZZZ